MWLNGKRRGVMVPSGLVGPLRWAIDVSGSSFRIDGPKAPFPVTSADLGEDERKQREFDAEGADDY